MKKFIKKYNPIIKLIIAFIIFFFSSLIITIPLNILKVDLTNKKTYYIATVAANILRAILIVILFRKDLKKDFKGFKENFWKYSDIAFKYWILGIIVMVVSNLLIIFLTPAKQVNNEQAVRDIISTIPVLALVITGITAPLTEELIFRKAFKNAIKDKITYILISGIVFGALHVVSSYDSYYDLLYIIPYSSLGIAFAATCYKTNNIYPSMMVHALHNTAGTIIYIISLGMLL